VRRVSVGLVGVLLAILGAVTYGSIRSLGRQQDVARACDAARLQRWNEALALSASITGPDADGRIATECRCWALLATSRRGECVDLVEGVLSRAQDWVPHPILAKLVIRVRRDQGRSAEAADLARRAARAHPRDVDLLTLELLTRSVGEGEEAVLDEMQARMRRATSAVANFNARSTCSARGRARSTTRFSPDGSSSARVGLARSGRGRRCVGHMRSGLPRAATPTSSEHAMPSA
jgi:hypothetical protein